jgi:hypothetical protein
MPGRGFNARGFALASFCQLALASFCQLELASFCQMAGEVTGTLDAACVVECSDGALAPRPGAPLVAIYRREPRDRSGREQRRRRRGKEVPPGGARPDDVDLGLRDPARELEAFSIGIGADNRPGQSLDLVPPGGIVTGGHAQAVTARVLRRPRFAGAGPRTGARARIAPVGIALAGAGHAASSRAGRSGSRVIFIRASLVACGSGPLFNAPQPHVAYLRYAVNKFIRTVFDLNLNSRNAARTLVRGPTLTIRHRERGLVDLIIDREQTMFPPRQSGPVTNP